MHAQTHAHTLIRGRDQREQEGEMSGSVCVCVCVCVHVLLYAPWNKMEEGRCAYRVTYNVLRPEVASCHAQQGAITWVASCPLPL